MAVKKPQIPIEEEVDPKYRERMERSILSRDQAPTMAEQTPDFSTWQKLRDELGPPFDNERVTLRQMRQLRKDPMIAFGLHYRKVPIARAEWHIEARDKNGVNAQVQAFLDAALRRIYARYIFQRMLALDFGFQAMVKRFTLANPGGVYFDPLEENPENAVKPVWDEGSVIPKIYKVPVALRPERVQPTFDDKTGEFTGMLYDVPPAQRGKSTGFKASKKKGNQGQREIDIHHSLWATHQKDEEHGSIYGYPITGFARDYWWDYNFYRGLRRRAYERFAIPPVLAHHPEGSTIIDDLGNTRPNWEIAIEMAERLRGNAVAAVPSTMATTGMGDSAASHRAWDFTVMDVPTEALRVFDEVFNYLNVMKLRSVWVPEMAFLGKESGNSGGNIAAQMQEVFNASQALLMEEIISEINLYVLPPLLMMNFPEFIANGGSAKMVSHGFRSQDIEAYKQVLQLIGQANSPELVAQIDISELLKRLNMPLKDPQQFAREREQEAAALAAQGPPNVPGVTIRNPNFNPGATNGGSQPEPAMGFSDTEYEYVYLAPMGSVDLSVELAEVDNFLATLPTTKHYGDKTIRALAVQLRRLWAAHYKRLYRDLASQVKGIKKFEFTDDPENEGETSIKLTYGPDGMEFADPSTVAAIAGAAGVAFVTKKQAEKAARRIAAELKVTSKVLKELAERSAVIMRKMLKRAANLDLKQTNLKAELDEDAMDRFLEEQTGRLIKLTHATMKDEMRDFLVTNIREGKTPTEIADAITEHFDGFPATKADRIARSETRDVVNAATLIAGEATGVKYVKAHDGEEFDEDCKDRNGKLFTLKEAWRELHKEHPYGTLGYELLPRADFSIEVVDEMPEEMADRFAYFDDDSGTAFILSTNTHDEASAYLSALADRIIHGRGKVSA